MFSIQCIRCHREYFSAARPAEGARCPVCRGRLEGPAAESEAATPAGPPLGLPPMSRARSGSYREGPDTFSSIPHFLHADPRRGPSRERDLGLHWVGAHGRIYRAAWVEATGELILIQGGQPEEGGGHVEVIGVVEERDELDRALEGWESVCGREGSAQWLRTRAGLALQPAARELVEA